MSVLKQLLSIMAGRHPLEEASERFTEMLELVEHMVLEASAVYWGKVQTSEERVALYKQDVRVNQLERTIRKKVVTHLTGPGATDVPFGLLLMSLVKDVERLGDYAKNLVEVPGSCRSDLGEGMPHTLPTDDVAAELRKIARSVETIAAEASRVYARADKERAQELTMEGRSLSKRCDELLGVIARGDYSASVAVDLTLGSRFYKRIQGHLLNLLSAVLMPLHKLDYYDEDSVLDEE